MSTSSLKKSAMPRDTYVPALLQLFRQYGYDGATLSRIAAATGLGKASLYHHFPGGKDEMVEAVLAHLSEWLGANVLAALQSKGTAIVRLKRMCDRVMELYENGNQPCLSAILLLGSARDVFHDQVEQRYRRWIEAIAEVLIEAGFEAAVAQERGEDAIIALQGSLIVSQGLNDSRPFQRVMKQLPQQLCRQVDK
jgi:TetR/AcrR family transcriptional regulator, lmrAB and yxaGH operons repressor